MATVSSGTRVQAHSSDGSHFLLSRHDVVLVKDWCLVVSGAAEVLDLGELEFDIPTDEGMVTVRGELEAAGDELMLLRPTNLSRSILQQRRMDVRSGLPLPVSGYLVEPGVVRLAALEQNLPFMVFGETRDVSGGGLGIDLSHVDGSTPNIEVGRCLYLEMDLPGGHQVQALLEVVLADGAFVAGGFRDIALRDRETLIRMVFDHQRQALVRA